MTGQITVNKDPSGGLTSQVFAFFSQKKRKSLMWHFIHSAKKLNQKYLIPNIKTMIDEH